ncbi:MAG TPA: DoxX family membrane protein [Bacteroidia bacterium]|nr:DoxX family membrane protein [Bacteroidia bacterium]
MFFADNNLIVLEITTRWLLAILFFFQAYDRIFRVGLKEVTNIMYYQNTEQKFPFWFTKFGVYITAYTELICGILLFTGIFRDYALYILCLDMLIAAFGFSYLKPMWDMKHFFPRFILISIQLFLPSSAYVLGLEKLF